MNSELKIILTFLFKRSGKTQLKESELYLPLSLELGWFSASDAKALIQQAKENDLLSEKEGLFSPTFEYGEITVPVGFYPSKKPVDDHPKSQPVEEPPSVLNQLIEAIAKETKKSEEEIRSELSTVAEEKHILSIVAAAYIANQYNIDPVSYTHLRAHET